MAILGFKVDGGFITDIAREWFWKENRPFESIRQLLMSCMITDEITEDQKDQIIIQILEGRKKFVGVNTFVLEDDNENITPIGNKISENQFKMRLADLNKLIDTNPGDWVDIYSTVKSQRAYREKLRYKYPNPYDQYDYFRCSEDQMRNDYYSREYLESYNLPTKCGLWILEERDLILRCLDKAGKGLVISDEYWKFLYEEIKNRKGFSDRNKYYLACVRANDDLSDQDYDEAFNSLRRSGDHLIEEVEPDDMKSWEGLIDPRGNFYSCEFGAHNAKAYNIIKDNPKRFGLSKNKLYDFSIMNGSFDILIDHGWIATRYLQTRGFYYSRSVRKMTRAQENTLFDAMVKFGLNPSRVSEELYK